MHQIKHIASLTPMYPNLLALVRALLSLPVSNANSECCFSIVRKIDSEERNHLEHTTVVTLLSMKLNIDGDCFDFKPPEL